MKFEWQDITKYVDNIQGQQTYGLYLVHAGHFKRLMGSLTKLSRAWRIYSLADKDMYWLDDDLSLDEAQRAAKLFLCVGRQ